ncbi:MAG: hypothetical protein JJE35_04015 [Thermoleophilia bacterium]|nr:hypothetical protein [Thermoleophilia bacterium]
MSTAGDEGAALRLDPETVEALARRIAELLGEHRTRSGLWLLDVDGLARLLGVQSRWVYEHAGELGAIRLGEGRRPRLRFDPEEAVERLARRAAAPSGGEQSFDSLSVRSRARFVAQHGSRPGRPPRMSRLDADGGRRV